MVPASLVPELAFEMAGGATGPEPSKAPMGTTAPVLDVEQADVEGLDAHARSGGIGLRGDVPRRQ